MQTEITQEDRQLVEKAGALANNYNDFAIVNQVQLEAADGHKKIISDKYKEIDAKRKSIVDPINKAKQAVQDLFNPPLARLKQAQDTITSSMKVFIRKEEDKRLAEERKLQEKARAEEERQRKILEERAKKAEEKGNEDKAESLREQAEEVFVPAPVIEKVDLKVDNRSVRFTYKAQVKDIRKLAEHALKTGDLNLIAGNETVLNGRAREHKKAGEIIPGVLFIEK